jgi:exopolysaccharide biosynthesis protein
MNTLLHQLHRYGKWIMIGIIFIASCKATSITEWQHLAPGLDYTVLNLDTGKLHAFKIDLKENRLAILSPPQPSMIKDMVTDAHALLAVNGGFFTPTGKPLGLRINDGKILSPSKPISWWGIFSLHNNTPALSSFKDFTLSNDIDFAIQAGPRLLIHNTIPHLKEGVGNRTAIGYNQDNDIIIVVSEDAQLTTLQLAEILGRSEKHGGLGCLYALNLDGGSSSQAYVDVGDFVLDVPSFRTVADGVAVYPR